ncbi:MAG: response regulator [Proteobacteria bacterium]|nr:response regulator [Pseudomonadota bacterium]
MVVDDEPLARANLIVLLGLDPDIGRIQECGSGAEAVAAIRTRQPDLVFLDVQMPEYDGFDVLELLDVEVPPVVIFVTAHDEYALRAFEVGALDYLMKPFSRSRLERALARAKQRLADQTDRRFVAPQRLIVKSAGQVAFVNIAAIDWIDSANYYSCLHVGGNTHVVRRSLVVLERELGLAPFARIHRSTLVNLERVRGLELMDDGEYAVVLVSGDRLRVSRRYRKLLQESLGVSPNNPTER